MTEKTQQIIIASTPMLSAPDTAGGLETECLFGESVTILKTKDQWCLVKLETDSYQGWVRLDALGTLPPPNHRVVALRTVITSTPDVKSASRGHLPMGAKIAVLDHDAQVARIVLGGQGTDQGETGFVSFQHLTPSTVYHDDWVALAEQFLNTPYRWGGRDSISIDCSALIQLALAAGGIASPRNSGDQQATLGETLDASAALRRGDLIFWAGHVGVMRDEKLLLHANAFHQMVASEPLDTAAQRIKSSDGGSISRRARLPA